MERGRAWKTTWKNNIVLGLRRASGLEIGIHDQDDHHDGGYRNASVTGNCRESSQSWAGSAVHGQEYALVFECKTMEVVQTS